MWGFMVLPRELKKMKRPYAHFDPYISRKKTNVVKIASTLNKLQNVDCRLTIWNVVETHKSPLVASL